MTMERYVASKRNVFFFQTERGVFAIGAEDPNDVADSQWFREFLGLRKVSVPQKNDAPIALEDLPDELPEIKEPVRVQVRSAQRPVAQPAPVAPVMPPQQTFMDIRPDVMTEEVWRAMSDQQKADWRKKWLGM